MVNYPQLCCHNRHLHTLTSISPISFTTLLSFVPFSFRFTFSLPAPLLKAALHLFSGDKQMAFDASLDGRPGPARVLEQPALYATNTIYSQLPPPFSSKLDAGVRVHSFFPLIFVEREGWRSRGGYAPTFTYGAVNTCSEYTCSEHVPSTCAIFSVELDPKMP